MSNCLNTGIVRKLGAIEKAYSVDRSTYKHMVFTLGIKTRFNLLDSKHLLSDAIFEWKQMNPFLRCFVQCIDNEHYFVYSDYSIMHDSMHNVNLLSLKLKNGETNVSCSDLMDLLTERELTIPITCDSGNLLWRLKLLKIETQNQSTSTFEYGLLFSINHSICDGISGYMCLLQLFGIIENLYTGNLKQSLPYQISLPMESYLFNSFQDKYFSGPNTKVPSFCDTKVAKEETINFNSNKLGDLFEDSIHYYGKENAKPFIKIKQLMAISKLNNSKFKIFSIDGEYYNRLINKCKLENVKMNSCFNLVFALATRMLYRSKLDLNNDETVVYCNGVSLRNYLKTLTDHDFRSISYLANKFVITLPAKQDGKDFWKLAKENSINIHSKLEDNQLKRPNDPKESNQNQKLFYHFFLSNYGLLPSSLTTNKLIEVENFMATQYIHKNNNSFICFIFASTINNKVTFTVRFNSNFVCPSLIDLFIKKSKEIFMNILN